MSHDVFALLVLLVYKFDVSNAAVQRAESAAVTVQSRGAKQEFNIDRTDHTIGRHFVSTAANGVSVSPLILESHHHEIVPTQPSPFVVSPTGIPSANIGNVEKLATAVHANPVLAALLINSLLGNNSGPRPVAYNTPEHEPPNPYVALLLSHYGRYIPRPGIFGHGLYGYSAANNIHNTRPFGSYKIYDDSS